MLKRNSLSVKNYSIGANVSLMMISAALVASVIIGVMSYIIYRNAHFNYKANSTLDIVEAVTAFIDGDKFSEIVELNERTEYQREIQRIIEIVGQNSGITSLYAVAENWDGINYRYIFDDVDEEHFGNLDPIDGFGAEETFETGVSSIDQFYDDTGNYGDMISCFVAIRDSSGNVVGVMGADNVLSDVVQEVNDFAGVLIAVILTINILFVLVLRLYINHTLVGPLANITKDADKIARGDLSVTFGDTAHDENSRNELITLRGALAGMLTELNGKHSLKLAAIKAEYEKEKLEEASKAKNLYFARMSHEIRTPMNAVMGMSELLLRKELPHDVYEHVLMIKGASVNLLSIINDILDFSKMESGKLEIVEAEYMFPSLINDVVNVALMRITEKPVQFITYVDSDIPARLIGDEVRLRQIVTNLLSNAAKYTTEGYISFSVTGTAKDGVVMLTFEISDSGIGIKEEDLGRLFGDFVQFDAEKNKKVEGTGLGLAISRNLCLLMGGDITVQSEYGKGSVFTAVLPQKFEDYEPFASVDNLENKLVLLYESRKIHRDSISRTLEKLGVKYKCVESISELSENIEKYDYVFVSSFLYGNVSSVTSQLKKSTKVVLLSDINEAPPSKDLRTLLLPAHALSVANILNDVRFDNSEKNFDSVSFVAPEVKILVVDDMAVNLKVAEGLLSPYGMQLTLCTSGPEALRLVAENQYDLVFMDHMMPEMDGLETAKRIRGTDGEYFKFLPIIALTANAVSGMREMFIQNGMSDFLSKPIEIAKLDSILEKWVPKDKQQRRHRHSSASAGEQSTLTETLKAMPELSVDKAVAAIGGSTAMYEDIVRLSARLMPENIERLNSLMDSDWAKYTIEIHGVKSILKNMGAYELGEGAFQLEELSRNRDFDACRKLHSTFIEKLVKFHESLKIQTDKNESTEKKEGSFSFLRRMFSELTEAADSYDGLRALDILHEIGEYSFGSETDATLGSLTLAFERFDFDEAGELLDDLRGLIESTELAIN